MAQVRGQAALDKHPVTTRWKAKELRVEDGVLDAVNTLKTKEKETQVELGHVLKQKDIRLKVQRLVNPDLEGDVAGVEHSQFATKIRVRHTCRRNDIPPRAILFS